jgi:hypothetical protein
MKTIDRVAFERFTDADLLFASRRTLILDDVVYRADRDGKLWYALVVDPKKGRLIDRRVPSGMFKTMRETHDAIRRRHARTRR